MDPKDQVNIEDNHLSTSLISTNMALEGELYGEENIRIDGRFLGRMKLDGNILIGDTAVVEADVEGDNIVIRGTVKGSITARGHLVLASTARMLGDISAATIDIQEGSLFEGHSRMSGEEP